MTIALLILGAIAVCFFVIIMDGDKGKRPGE